jgi:hypothetical protein
VLGPKGQEHASGKDHWLAVWEINGAERPWCCFCQREIIARSIFIILPKRKTMGGLTHLLKLMKEPNAEKCMLDLRNSSNHFDDNLFDLFY